MEKGNQKSFDIKRAVFLGVILIVYFVTSLGFAPLVKSIFVYNLPIPEGSAYTDTWKFYDQLGDYAYSLTTYLKFKGDEINTESEDFIDYFINEGKGSQIADTYYEYASMRRLAEILAEIEKKAGKSKDGKAVPYEDFAFRLFGIKSGDEETEPQSEDHDDGFRATSPAGGNAELHSAPALEYKVEYHTSPNENLTEGITYRSAQNAHSIDLWGDLSRFNAEEIDYYLKKYNVVISGKEVGPINIGWAQDLLERFDEFYSDDHESNEEYAESLYELYSETVRLFARRDFAEDYSPEKIIAYYAEQMKTTENKVAAELNADFYLAQQLLGSYSNFKYIFYDTKTGNFESNFYEGAVNPENPLNISLNADELSWLMVYSEKSGLKIGKPENKTASELSITPSPYSKFDLTRQAENRLKGYCSNRYILYLALPKTLVNSDLISDYSSDFEVLSKSFNKNLTTFIVGMLLSIVFTIAFSLTSGESEDGGRLYFIDRIFNDVHFAASSAVIVSLAITTVVLLKALMTNGALVLTSDGSPVYRFAELNRAYDIIVPAAMMISAAASLELLSSISRNTRLKRYFSHTLAAKILGFILGIFRRFWKFIKRIINFVLKPFRGLMQMASMFTTNKLKTLTKSLLFYSLLYFGINAVLVLFFIASAVNVSKGGTFGSVFFTMLIGVAFNTVVLYKVFMFLESLDSIIFAASQIAQGRYNIALNIPRMPRLLKSLASDLLNINAGTKAAVETAVKGERLKAELITNVSHDLKTPLTSIVNYVDLLQRSGEYGEPANEYIKILKEKSNRLKALIDDLMEASKVSTGNIKINLSPVNLYELAMQISGEHSDVLEEKGIDIIIAKPEVEPIVWADSQQTWRIIENLFSNVKKYTMPGTRVYVDTTIENGYGCFSIKNISADALNMPAEELTQRFVRNDEARSGEGSGLGLSIAESLCKLQKGEFSITIDGDLFKVKVCLPIYRGNQES